MKRVETLTDKMFFGQVASSSLGSVIILYVILTVSFPINPIDHLIFVLCIEIESICMLSTLFSAALLARLWFTLRFDVSNIHRLFAGKFRWTDRMFLNRFIHLFVCLLFNSPNGLHAILYQGINYNRWIFHLISFKIQHDRVYEAALLVNFNELPRTEQRLYRFFIKGCQKPALLTIGGLAPLNLATCVTVCVLKRTEYGKFQQKETRPIFCIFFLRFVDLFTDLFDYNDGFYDGYSVKISLNRAMFVRSEPFWASEG